MLGRLHVVRHLLSTNSQSAHQSWHQLSHWLLPWRWHFRLRHRNTEHLLRCRLRKAFHYTHLLLQSRSPVGSSPESRAGINLLVMFNKRLGDRKSTRRQSGRAERTRLFPATAIDVQRAGSTTLRQRPTVGKAGLLTNNSSDSFWHREWTNGYARIEFWEAAHTGACLQFYTQRQPARGMWRCIPVRWKCPRRRPPPNYVAVWMALTKARPSLTMPNPELFSASFLWSSSATGFLAVEEDSRDNQDWRAKCWNGISSLGSI